MSTSRTAVRIVVPLAVLGVGVAVMVGFLKSKRAPKPRDHARSAALVDVRVLAPQEHPRTVRTQGVVTPAARVTVVPQVAGRLVEVHPALVVGGRVARGERLFRVEAREYVLAVRQAEAQVAQAEFALALERGRKDVAEREWAQLERGGPGGSAPTGSASDPEGGALARREPHLRAALASVDAAKAALERAQINVGRTSVRAPFDALVVAEEIEVGQVVGPQTRAATLVATDRYEVLVSLPMTDLEALEIPGARAVVFHGGPDKASRRPARVVRILGAVERSGRLARVVLEVREPLETGQSPGDPATPLLLDDFVEVEIVGHALAGVYEVPRTALQEGDRVHLMTGRDTLDIRVVQVAWRARDAVYVSAGLERGERLVISPLATPTRGQLLRTTPDSPPAAAATSGPPKSPEAP